MPSNELDGIHTNKMIGVYTGERAYHFDKLDVWPVEDYLKKLHDGEILYFNIS
jgi:hypothetical protein